MSLAVSTVPPSTAAQSLFYLLRGSVFAFLCFSAVLAPGQLTETFSLSGTWQFALAPNAKAADALAGFSASN